MIAATPNMKPNERPTLQDLDAAANTVVGLECPDCKSQGFRVMYTRSKEGRIERRRVCVRCGRKVTTHERLIG